MIFILGRYILEVLIMCSDNVSPSFTLEQHTELGFIISRFVVAVSQVCFLWGRKWMSRWGFSCLYNFVFHRHEILPFPPFATMKSGYVANEMSSPRGNSGAMQTPVIILCGVFNLLFRYEPQTRYPQPIKVLNVSNSRFSLERSGQIWNATASWANVITSNQSQQN